MKAVTPATMFTLERFKKKLEEMIAEHGDEGHPYAMAIEGLEKLGKTEWDEKHQNSAIEALALWCANIVGQTGAATLNEILALMRIANDSPKEKHKEAAKEMAASMNFLEIVLTCYVNAVDFQHIAEWLFEDGQRRWANKESQPQAPEVPEDWWKRFGPSSN